MANTKKRGDIFDRFIASINWKWGSFDMLPIWFGVVMALLDIVMMSSAKMIHTGSLSWNIGFPLSTGIYALQPFIFLKALSHSNMTVTNLIWNLASDILVTLQGVFIFGESIEGLRWLAVAMSLFSLGLFAYTDSKE